MKKLKALLSIALAVIMLAGCAEDVTSEKAPEKVIEKAPDMRDITTMELVQDMGLGINLGNTLEACGSWIGGQTVSAYEKAWGSPIITEDIIKNYANLGFKVMRVPVAWSNLMGANYEISAELMDRVEEVIGYVLNNGMYAILNIHYDGGWLAKFSTDYDKCMEKYTAIWEQITERFKDYNDYLMFGSQNEDACFDELWNRWGGSIEGKDKAFGLVYDINQSFVDIVRSSGGNNPKRHLLIAGYGTDVELTCDEYFKMPIDAENRCAVSVHYYTPSTFAIIDKDASWGKAKTTWGTERDITELNKYMDMLKTTFIDNGIPVIVGEYGAATKNKEAEQVRNYIISVCKAALERDLCPVLWDVSGGGLYDRISGKFIDPLLEEEYKKIMETM